MWYKRSNLLHSLTTLTSNKVKFKWTDSEQKVFNEIKEIVARNTLLIYPDLNKHFDIHTDANDFQLGVLIIQEGKPIDFYSGKLTGPQTWYTVTEKE